MQRTQDGINVQLKRFIYVRQAICMQLMLRKTFACLNYDTKLHMCQAYTVAFDKSHVHSHVSLSTWRTWALRHSCICLKPAPKSVGHVDVDPAVLPRCNLHTTPDRWRFVRRNTDRFQETGRIDLHARDRRARSLSHGASGLWMKTQPFHLEVIKRFLISNICVLCVRSAAPRRVGRIHRANS